MNVKYAREQTIKMMERMLKRYKKNTRNPKLPGPKYYEGCFKKGKKKQLMKAEPEEEVGIES